MEGQMSKSESTDCLVTWQRVSAYVSVAMYTILGTSAYRVSKSNSLEREFLALYKTTKEATHIGKSIITITVIPHDAPEVNVGQVTIWLYIWAALYSCTEHFDNDL